MIDAAEVQGTLAERAARIFTEYQSGDQSRAAELVELLTPILWHTARAQRLDHQSAEDVVQVTWMALLRHSDSIADPRAVLQWLIVTARREAWLVIRRQGRVDIREGTGDQAAVSADDMPEEIALRGETSQRLWHHISTLPEKCRHLLRVIAFSDRPDYAEIANSLGMPVGSIGPTRGRCLGKLRAVLANDPRWDSNER